MRKHVLIIGVGVTLALGCSAFAIAGGPGHAESPPASAAPKPAQKSAAAKAVAAVRQVQNARGCRTVGCFNQKLKQLTKAVNGLAYDAYTCERVVPITQYGDFADVNGFATTGLDYTAAGSVPSDNMVVYTC